MLTPFKVFLHRVKLEEKFKLGVIKQVVDWVVALYLVIPAVAFFIYYYQLWLFNPPDWFSFVLLPFILVALYLFSWSGSIRLFLEDADRIFLLAQKIWIEKIKRYGIAYSLIIKLGQTLFVFVLLAPLFKYHQLELIRVLALAFFVFLVKVFSGLVRQLLGLRWQGWRLFVLDKLIYILGFANFAMACFFIYNTQFFNFIFPKGIYHRFY